MKNQTNKKKQQTQTETEVKPLDADTIPFLRFTPYAWAKLHWFCHHGGTEIGGFGITPADDLLLIEDFVTVHQSASVVHVAFDDDAVADFFDQQVDAGLTPQRFARIWLHTHPGSSPYPSGQDEETFSRVFGSCDWAVMFILAREGKSYARLRFNIGPGGQSEIPVQTDFDLPFTGSDHDKWLEEYKANVKVEVFTPGLTSGVSLIDDEWPAISAQDRLLARTQDMSPDELEDFFKESEV